LPTWEQCQGEYNLSHPSQGMRDYAVFMTLFIT
jgi:hypothetical protein